MSYLITLLKTFTLVLSLVVLTACGGSGDSNSPDSNSSSSQNNSSGSSGSSGSTGSSTNTYEDMRPFITTWDTTGYGVSDDNQILIKTNQNYTYDYHIDWGDGHCRSKSNG